MNPIQERPKLRSVCILDPPHFSIFPIFPSGEAPPIHFPS
jgi:hypothetical protein